MKKTAILLSVLLIFLSACSKQESEAIQEKLEYAIGEVAEMKGLTMSVNSSRLLEGNDYLNPEEGTEWVAYDITFENTGDEQKYIGAILEITLKDTDGRSKDYNIFGETNGTLDSTILPGEKLSGEISFVVTGDEAELYLYYQPTLSTSKPIKFKVK